MQAFVCGELFFKCVCLLQPLYVSLISQQASEEHSHSKSCWRIYRSRPRETLTAGEALLRPPKNWSGTAALLSSVSSSSFPFVLKVPCVCPQPGEKRPVSLCWSGRATTWWSRATSRRLCTSTANVSPSSLRSALSSPTGTMPSQTARRSEPHPCESMILS